ncbi:MAG: hypothetical protein U1E45_15050 [Geminicoccaceae bacterium]
MGLRDQILTADDLPRQAVEMPEWGCTVWVRGLTAGERDIYVDRYAKRVKDGDPQAMALLVVLGTVDETGANVFTLDDVEAVGRKASTALEKVARPIRDLSGLSPASVEAAEKNSGRGRTARSSSA